ncbi:Mannose-6-phosphate isomerase, cupin superfamily [Marinobacter daqiaonensis]|uniref:Mannose-6-phosphate isomerase, cupin superfamily n=1 Tax=Marinobacter daqiaonensis TaxID=650891 RepID=A0A1I6I3F3_9GAMM|nr:cupin domain-containing protein [Marinobacter daqiaonensis]SFR61168.1 Mannose-6-phosphate isomerase, cupin superfamily [Marinobacter daqiaonensis]
MKEVRRTTLPIVEMARENTEFRQVIWTGDNTQLVLMAIPEGGEIGGEVHEGHDQLLYFVEGEGEATIGDTRVAVRPGDVSIVPSGSYHNFRNAGSTMLKLYTTYCPPEHAPGTEHETKQQADADE